MAPLVNDSPHSHSSPGEDERDEFPPNNNPIVVIDFESGDSDQEEVLHSLGYELLPQEPDNEMITPGLEPTKLEHVIDKTLDMPARGSTCDTPDEQYSMDQDHIDKIKAAMSGFLLPITSIPSWAIEIPEEQWKEHLLERINRTAAHCSVVSNEEEK